MKKLGLLFKETSQRQIKDNLKESESVFIINYSGLSSPDLTALRQSLKSMDASLFVVKNTVARRALKDVGLEPLIKSIESPCGLVFIKKNPVGVSGVLCKFLKEHEQLKLEAGFLKDKILEKKDIEVLARLPSLEVLKAQIAMGLKSPITGFVMALKHTLNKFAWCLERIKDKKRESKGG